MMHHPTMSSRVLRSLMLLCLSLTVAFGAVSCFRGKPSKEPPVHINPNMDNQPKYKAQSQSEFFEDGATMRTPVAGTVASDGLRDDVPLYTGKDENGRLLDVGPLAVDMVFLRRGHERYDIYCSPCHSRLGDGKGIMLTRGYVPPPTFHSQRLREMPDGQIFDVITNGVRNMPSYRHQIPVKDRWAIVAYVRALQRSQNATLEDVPEEIRERVNQGSSR